MKSRFLTKFPAKFIGSDSLGYKRGKDYMLRGGVFIERLDGTGQCWYQSIETFLKNWAPIKLKSITVKPIAITEKLPEIQTDSFVSKQLMIKTNDCKDTSWKLAIFVCSESGFFFLGKDGERIEDVILWFYY